jgi:hypothetical protein
MKSGPEVPEFQSEAEEAQWWFEHRDETALWMEQAKAEGRTTTLERSSDSARKARHLPFRVIQL